MAAARKRRHEEILSLEQALERVLEGNEDAERMSSVEESDVDCQLHHLDHKPR